MKEKTARNDQIRREYHKGLGTILGDKHGITRQAIHEIVHRPSQKRCGGRQDGLKGLLVSLVARIKKSRFFTTNIKI